LKPFLKSILYRKEKAERKETGFQSAGSIYLIIQAVKVSGAIAATQILKGRLSRFDDSTTAPKGAREETKVACSKTWTVVAVEGKHSSRAKHLGRDKLVLEMKEEMIQIL
jgi:hypothetical protein